MEVRKVSDQYYVCKPTNEELEEFNKIIKQLSLDLENNYDVASNEYLFDILLSRRIGSEFLIRKIDLTKTGFAIADVNIGNRVVSISIGEVMLDTKKIVSGVIYK